jgi:DNA mismatch endonuclease, patch repair protein
MAKIRSKDTKPEMILRSMLHRQGLRYRIHKKDLPGKPDIVFIKKRIAVFVHGCFWHLHSECKEGRIPSSNSKFWKEKLERNVSKDLRNYEALNDLGWKVLVVWECEIEKDPDKVLERLFDTFH